MPPNTPAMPFRAAQLPYSKTENFSPLVLDYLAEKESLKDLYAFSPDKTGITEAIEARKDFLINRALLTEVLKDQYKDLPENETALQQIERLNEATTFTVCTAHQPNLATGYLYFIYKILHAIKLADELNKEYPQNHFVPVYYMGSEDNDLAELGTFRYGDKKFVWAANGQSGAVGRMDTKSLKPLLEELFRIMGPPGNNYNELKELFTEAYLNHNTIAQATRYLVHRLFGRYGLLILDPDDARLKGSFIPVMQMDLFQNNSGSIVQASANALTEYKSQAFARPVNLFYLKDNIRERIERKGDRWEVLNTEICWGQDELLKELNDHPEHFSPNVILRPLYQETILPDVAFIGGGAEVAYWLQLKALFEAHKVFYPAIILRQSVLIIPKEPAVIQGKMELSDEQLFLEQHQLEREWLNEHAPTWQLDEELEAFKKIMLRMQAKATEADPTLTYAAGAALARIQKQIKQLEQKMLRAEKKRQSVAMLRIEKLKSTLFPDNSLQERTENFIPYFLQHGHAFFESLHNNIQPMTGQFLTLTEIPSSS